jgi:DNA gyrase subunit A
LLTKAGGLLTKIDNLRRFLNQYDNPDEILLLEDSGLDSSFLYFTENGRCYWETNKHLPWYPANTTAHDAMQTQREEKMTCALQIKDFNSDESIVLCTTNGVVKKSQLSSFKNFSRGGMISMITDLEDSVKDAIKVKAHDHVLLITQKGKGLRFSCDHQLRDQGRVTRGVRGIRLKSDDEVVSMLRVDDSKCLLLVSRSGLVLRTRLSAFLPNGGNLDENAEDVTPRKRGGQGVTAMNTEAVFTAIQVDAESEILIVTEMGRSAIVRTQNIRESNRGSKGVRGIRLDSGDAVQSVFLVP